MIKTNIMKSLRILMAVLFMSAVLVSCGSSPEDDGARACELAKEMVEKASDKEAMKALEAEAKELEDKYGKDGSASDDDKKAYEEAVKKCAEGGDE